MSWNQSQITDASHLFVFCNYTNVKPEDIDAYIQLTSHIRKVILEKLGRLNACVIATVGYIDTNDKSQDLLKVRKPNVLLFEEA